MRNTPEQRLGEDYPVEVGLLALLIEVTSVVASEQKMKKPITGLAKQFSNANKAPARPTTPEETDRAFKHGIGVLAATAKAVRR